MIHTKRVIFMILPLLFVPLVYSISSTRDACAAPPLIPDWDYSKCSIPTPIDPGVKLCCWTDPVTEPFGIRYCQSCLYDIPSGDYICSDIETHYPGMKLPTPSPTPSVPEGALPQGEIQQPTPTPPPTGGKGLFGSEVLPTPPTGLAQPTEPPAPTSEPTVPPEAEEDGTGGGGGIKPPVEDLLPETGIEEQPEVKQPEQEQPSGEGQGPAGPLT